MSSKQLALANIDDAWAPIFGEDFLPRLAGHVMSDPHFALVELVANSWDAGATEVQIIWPSSQGELISVEDNGISMTQDELQSRWRDLTYNRTTNQGLDVKFPGKTSRKRTAYGKNGIGRHSMFCFCDEYFVELNKEGERAVFSIKRTTGERCFNISLKEEGKTNKVGTRIYSKAMKNVESLDPQAVTEFIGSRFIADPEFSLSVNNQLVTMQDLDHLVENINITLDSGESIDIKRFDSEKTGRTSKQSGIAYWVNKKLVGTPSWEGYDGTLLDARHKEAKRYTYIVQADFLGKSKGLVKPDWSGLYSSPIVNELKKKVSFAIRDDLKGLTKELRKRNREAAINANRSGIARLPLFTKAHIQKFADEVQLNCPTMSAKDLENAVATLINLEQARTGYSILEKLASLEPSDLDNLDAILDEWSITDAKKVLEEVEWRIKLIIKMESLVDVKSTDELHQIQPLFDRGLWILGNNYDSLDFVSNRTLSTVLRRLFDEENVSQIRDRPDFVVIPHEESVSVFSRDSIGKPGEESISGYDSIVILELKKAGIPLSFKELDQAKKYAREIRRRVPSSTNIYCYILGQEVNGDLPRDGEAREGNTYFYPTEYMLILNQAKKRMFKLRDGLSSFDYLIQEFDEEAQGDLFSA